MVACKTPGEHLPNRLSRKSDARSGDAHSQVLPRELRRQACQLSKTSELAATKPGRRHDCRGLFERDAATVLFIYGRIE